MSNLIDLTGQRFGKLTVISRVENNRYALAQWECVCDCGESIIITGYKLRKGASHCGCQVAPNRNNLLVDLTGRKFDKLTVTGRAKNNRAGLTQWECICDCGKKITKTGGALKSKSKSHCGCLNIYGEVSGKNHPLWIVGPNFSLYDSYAHKLVEETRRCPNDSRILQVRCHYCERWFSPKRVSVASRTQILSDIGDGSHLYCSDECKGKCSTFGKSEYRDGEKLNEREYQYQFRGMVIKRDGMCLKCFYKYGIIETNNLEAHHIKPFKDCREWEADIENGITLCKHHHAKITHGTKDEKNKLNRECLALLNRNKNRLKGMQNEKQNRIQAPNHPATTRPLENHQNCHC